MNFLKSTKGKLIICFMAVAIIIGIVFSIVYVFGDKEAYRVISLSEISGDVKVENEGMVYDAYADMNISDGYALFTGLKSYTRMVLDSDKYVKLEEESRAVFEKLGLAGDNSTTIRLEKGVITNEITKPLATGDSYIVNTPNAVLAVRGTYFRVQVIMDENGDYFTDVFTYGGSVECKRILPDGSVVNESVIVNSGYKTRIKMNETDTVYLVEEIDEYGNVTYTSPIVISEDISDDDLVDMLDTAQNGHSMFLTVGEIEAIIRERSINVGEYHSKYDGSEITLSDAVVTTAGTSASSETAVHTTTVTAIQTDSSVDGVVETTLQEPDSEVSEEQTTTTVAPEADDDETTTTTAEAEDDSDETTADDSEEEVSETTAESNDDTTEQDDTTTTAPESDDDTTTTAKSDDNTTTTAAAVADETTTSGTTAPVINYPVISTTASTTVTTVTSETTVSHNFSEITGAPPEALFPDIWPQ